MIKLLPEWILTNTTPGFYDCDSGTTVEQTAKVYRAMRELQTEYNTFATSVNECITNFINDTNADQECFKNQLTKLIHDYIAMIDEKIKLQDKEIEESITYIKNNISESVESVVNEMKESGELDSALVESFNNLSTEVNGLTTKVETLENSKPYCVYDEMNKSLTFINMEEVL